MSHSSMQEQLEKEIEGLRADLAAIERRSGGSDSPKPRRRKKVFLLGSNLLVYLYHK